MIRRPLSADRSGATALEFALVFPCILLFIFSFIAAYSLFATRRAIDYGTEKALRYAAVHSGTPTSTITNAYNTAAGIIWRTVGTASSVSYKTSTNGTTNSAPTTFAVGDILSLSVTYNWGAPAFINVPFTTTILIPFTITSTASIRIMN